MINKVFDQSRIKKAADDPKMEFCGGMKFESNHVTQKDAKGNDVDMVNVQFTALVPPYLAVMLNKGIRMLIQAIQETLGEDAVICQPPGNIEEQEAVYEKASQCIGLPASTLYGDGKDAN